MGSALSFFRNSRKRVVLLFVATALLVAGGLGIAVGATSSYTPVPNAYAPGHGINEFGMTKAFFKGRSLDFTYTHGFWCDKSVSSAASSKCEAGANFKKAPNPNFDPLYITVPLGFAGPRYSMECPAGEICVDHPGTIDLSRLEPALKPLYPSLTAAQLRAALKNVATPAHNHIITTTNNGVGEWWDVKVIGVTNKTTFANINQHKDYAYILKLLKEKNKYVTAPIPTNLFLFFGVN